MVEDRQRVEDLKARIRRLERHAYSSKGIPVMFYEMGKGNKIKGNKIEDNQP